MPDYVGEAYAEEYCLAEIITDVTQRIQEVIAVYRERMQRLDWMRQVTKEKALHKLDIMQIHVGASETFVSALDSADFKTAEEGGSYFDNIMEICKAQKQELLCLDGQPVDKVQWITTPQTVNAFYSPQFNSINFPAAFLQASVYDKNADRESNLGGLGTVIGYEITHAFDSSGVQFGKNKNAMNWWTEEDAKVFDLPCQDVVRFYSGQEAAQDIVIDPTLTLTENIADLGGMVCINQIGMQ